MIRVAVLAGGCSPEHEISLLSGAQVLAHLDRGLHQVWPVRLRRDGRWAMPERPLAPDAAQVEFPGAAAPSMLPGAGLAQLIEGAGIEVVFPVLHGPFGEDGTLQGMCDLHGLRYVGSDCAASAVAMDKIRTRECLAAAGLPMAPAYMPHKPLQACDPEAEAAAIAAGIGFPCFVKTDLSGSSLGVARVEGPEELGAFFAACRGLGRRYFAEQPVQGEEISVPVLGNSGAAPEALPPIGIYPRAARFFDHGAKYDPSATEEIVPPRGLDAAAIETVQALALRAHEALQCDGLSRTDMIVTATGPVLLEVNTLPGFTTASLYPKAAAAHGIPYPELLSRLVQLALSRPPRLQTRSEP